LDWRFLGLIVIEDGALSQISGGRFRSHTLDRIADRPIIEHVLETLELARGEEVLVTWSNAHSNGIRGVSARARDRMGH
jgi:hypothetical protein